VGTHLTARVLVAAAAVLRRPLERELGADIVEHLHKGAARATQPRLRL
jgi:hypothetical protein